MNLEFSLAPNVRLIADGKIFSGSGRVECHKASIHLLGNVQTVTELEPYTETTLWRARGSLIRGNFLIGKRILL